MYVKSLVILGLVVIVLSACAPAATPPPAAATEVPPMEAPAATEAPLATEAPTEPPAKGAPPSGAEATLVAATEITITQAVEETSVLPPPTEMLETPTLIPSDTEIPIPTNTVEPALPPQTDTAAPPAPSQTYTPLPPTPEIVTGIPLTATPTKKTKPTKTPTPVVITELPTLTSTLSIPLDILQTALAIINTQATQTKAAELIMPVPTDDIYTQAAKTMFAQQTITALVATIIQTFTPSAAVLTNTPTPTFTLAPTLTSTPIPPAPTLTETSTPVTPTSSDTPLPPTISPSPTASPALTSAEPPDILFFALPAATGGCLLAGLGLAAVIIGWLLWRRKSP